MSLAFQLVCNACLCLVCGIAMVLDPSWVDALLGNSYTGLIFLMGCMLVGWGGLLCYWAYRARQGRIVAVWLLLILVADYGWSAMVVALVSFNQVITSPQGIRVAFITALLTAGFGALQFRHYKILIGKY